MNDERLLAAEAREIQRLADEVVDEARHGLVAVRVIAGWRLTVERSTMTCTPPNVWELNAMALTNRPYPSSPPMALTMHIAVILTAAEAPPHIIDGALDVTAGTLRIAWQEVATP